MAEFTSMVNNLLTWLGTPIGLIIGIGAASWLVTEALAQSKFTAAQVKGSEKIIAVLLGISFSTVAALTGALSGMNIVFVVVCAVLSASFAGPLAILANDRIIKPWICKLTKDGSADNAGQKDESNG